MLKFLQVVLYPSKRISLSILVFTAIFFHGQLYGIDDEAYRLKRVVIDPGHGGRDPGAVGKRSKEKDIVLDISLKLGGYINQFLPEVEVIYTRNTDEFVELHRRAEIANRNSADLFISIHANANNNKNVKGTDTFVMGHHTSKENLEVAMKENASILLEDDYDDQYEGFDPNSSESYIIFSLLQNTFDLQSLDFASHVQTQFRERVGRIDRGVRRAGFLVLWQTTMPSVLVEVGFISNEQEELYLMSEAGQSYIASALFRAFRDYKVAIEKRSEKLYASGASMGDHIYLPAEQESMATMEPGKSDDAADNPNKDNIVFKVQVGSSRNKIPLDSDFFSGLDDIEVFESDGLYKYVVGGAATLKDIITFREKVNQVFPDAFIVAVRSGNVISLREAMNSD